MGAKQTKIEGCYLSNTPVAQNVPAQLMNMNTNAENDSIDPRSPAGCRTPIYLQNKRIDTNVQLFSAGALERDLNNDNSLDVLRKCFRGLTYNLNDPRSPSLNVNRTPLVLEDTLEKSLRLDDTFADLFVEPCLPETLNNGKQTGKNIDKKCDQNNDIEMPEEKVILDLEELMEPPHTPVALQQDIDPRSPSISVERTPIIFTDDDVDESSEDVMLESILATLSLNFNTSGNSSMASMSSQNATVSFNNKHNRQVVTKPTNKHLDRVRANKKSYPKSAHRKLKRRQSRQQIYEDLENQLPMTPKLKITQIDNNDTVKGKRTPLSCVRNRNATHTRSRSVESSAKSIKTRLAITSFDDALNPSANNNVPNLRILQPGSQDSVEV